MRPDCSHYTFIILTSDFCIPELQRQKEVEEEDEPGSGRHRRCSVKTNALLWQFVPFCVAINQKREDDVVFGQGIGWADVGSIPCFDVTSEIAHALCERMRQIGSWHCFYCAIPSRGATRISNKFDFLASTRFVIGSSS